jgi:hypothetical protein
VSAPALFAFVQVEVPWVLGPADGRYIVRGHAGEPEHVLVLRTLAAPVARGRFGRRRSRRPRPAPPSAAPATAIATRATLIRAKPLAEPGERWLRSADLVAEAGSAVIVLNRVLHAQRIATGDPTVPMVTHARALAVRVGVGGGEQVAEGRWASAVLVPPPVPGRGSRTAGLRPTERLAAILAGRDVTLACEELTLRARIDADADRWRDCAFQLDAAFDAALTELLPWSGQSDIDERLAELGTLRPQVAETAGAALEGGLDDARIATLTQALARLEATLRARTNAQLGG